MPILTDDKRLDWLEWMADKPGGLLLHAGGEIGPGVGLGMRKTGRTLRQAIDDAMRHDREWHERNKE